MDKCDSHDECFNRLYAKVEGMDDRLEDKLDRLYSELRNRLHDGDIQFAKLEMRIEQNEKALSAILSGRTYLKQRGMSIAFDLLKLAVVALFGAACWAFMNGYKG